MSVERSHLAGKMLTTKPGLEQARLQENEVTIMNLKQQLDILTRKLLTSENKYQTMSDFFDQFEAEQISKFD